MVLNPLNFIFLKSITPVLVVRHGFPDLKKNMSFSLENCNSALNPDLTLEKKQKETWWVPGLKPSFCYTALPSGANLIVFFHWFGPDETWPVTTPTSPGKWYCSEGLSGTSLTNSLKAWHTNRKRETWGNTISSVCLSMRDSMLYLCYCSPWGQLWTQDFMPWTHPLSVYQDYTLLLQLWCRQNTGLHRANIHYCIKVIQLEYS